MSHEKRGISRNPLEGRCGRTFLKRENKKTICKVTEAFTTPEVGSGLGPCASAPEWLTRLYSTSSQLNSIVQPTEPRVNPSSCTLALPTHFNRLETAQLLDPHNGESAHFPGGCQVPDVPSVPSPVFHDSVPAAPAGSDLSLLLSSSSLLSRSLEGHTPSLPCSGAIRVHSPLLH